MFTYLFTYPFVSIINRPDTQFGLVMYKVQFRRKMTWVNVIMTQTYRIVSINKNKL